MADVEGSVEINAKLPVGQLEQFNEALKKLEGFNFQRVNDQLAQTAVLIGNLNAMNVKVNGTSTFVKQMGQVKTALSDITQKWDISALNQIGAKFDKIESSAQKLGDTLKSSFGSVKSGGSGGLENLAKMTTRLEKLAKVTNSVDLQKMSSLSRYQAKMAAVINDPQGVPAQELEWKKLVEERSFAYQQLRDVKQDELRAQETTRREEYYAKRQEQQDNRSAGRWVQRGAATTVGAAGAIFGYGSNVAGAYARINPLDPFSFMEAGSSIRGSRWGLLDQAGGGLSGIGGAAMATGTPQGLGIGAALTGVGSIASIFGKLGGMHEQVFQSSLGIMRNISQSIVTVLGAAFNAIRTGLGFIIDTTRNVIGSIVKLASVGGLLAVGGAIGAITKGLGQATNYKMEVASGVGLRTQQALSREDARYFLNDGAMYEASQNLSAGWANFYSKGQAGNLLDPALLGLIGPKLATGDPVERGNQIIDLLADMLAKAKGTGDEHRIRTLAQESGFGTYLQAADVKANPAYAYRAGAMYAHSDQYGIEMRTRQAKFSYDQIIGKALPDVISDIGSTLWNNKIPLVGRTGQDIGLTFANMMAGIAPALRGEKRGVPQIVGNGLSLLSIIPNALGNLFPKQMGEAKSWFGGLKELVQKESWGDVWSYIFAGLKSKAGEIKDELVAIFERVKPALSALWSEVKSGVGSAVKTTASGENGILPAVVDFVGGLAKGIGNLFGGNNSETFAGLKYFALNLGVTLYEGLRPAIVAISGAFNGALDAIIEHVKFSIGQSLNPFGGSDYHDVETFKRAKDFTSNNITGREKWEDHRIQSSLRGNALKDLDSFILVDLDRKASKYADFYDEKGTGRKIAGQLQEIGYKGARENGLDIAGWKIASLEATNPKLFSEITGYLKTLTTDAGIGFLDDAVENMKAELRDIEKKYPEIKAHWDEAGAKAPASGESAVFKKISELLERLGNTLDKGITSKAEIENTIKFAKETVPDGYSAEVLSQVFGAYSTPYVVR
jgi:6-pyruvoyl-tetrahydropterin synthase